MVLALVIVAVIYLLAVFAFFTLTAMEILESGKVTIGRLVLSAATALLWPFTVALTITVVIWMRVFGSNAKSRRDAEVQVYEHGAGVPR